jgi:hypothetical protein
MEYWAFPLMIMVGFSLVIGYGIRCEHKIKMKELELIEKGIIIKK